MEIRPVMSKKKIDKISNEKHKIIYNFGFGDVDPENSDFETLAKGMGLDPAELAKVLSESMFDLNKKSQEPANEKNLMPENNAE